VIAEFATVLDDDQVERLHQASLEILAETGLLVRNEKARERFQHHGCSVDSETGIVRFPPDVVEYFRSMVPPTFTFHGRDPAYDRTIPNDAPLIATTSSAPFVVDPVTGEVRRSRSDDIARVAHLVNELSGYDVFSVSMLPDDAAEDQFSLSRFYPALKNTVKPVRTSVIDRREAEQVMKLGELIAGSPGAYWERPFITHGFCAIVSPLVMDVDSTEMLMFYAEKGIPCYGAIAPIAGVSTPMSLAGTVAVANAEWLATAVLSQMSRPETPTIHIFLPVAADMRDGAYAPGGIETGIMDMALSQMARFYNVPSGGYMGQTTSKLSDAQAGFEKSMTPTTGVLGGTDFLVMGGLLESLMTCDLGQVVIDNEVALMLKRMRRGIEVDHDELAVDVIKQVGPASMFIDHPHTMARMRTSAFLPDIADRLSREQWVEKGSLTAHARAMRRAAEILSAPNSAALAPDVDARVRAAFDGLVDGGSVLPEGWEAPERTAAPARRERRRRRAAG
jgi:trimethylamine---corrinoid protein Co-methyltransferase